MDFEIEQYLAEFLGMTVDRLRTLSKNERNRQFENLVAFHTLKRWHQPQMAKSDLPLVMTGMTDDDQIDTLSIIINGTIVNDIDQARQALEQADDPQITYAFIQSTTSKRFERSKMNEFARGVKYLFREDLFFEVNDEIKRKRELREFIQETVSTVSAPNIDIALYFVALGEWKEDRELGRGDDQPLGWRKYAEREILEAVQLKSPPEAQVIDKVRLKELISKNAAENETNAKAVGASYSRVINANNLIPLPAIGGGEDGYSGYTGYIAGWQFLNLLEREDGQGLLDEIWVNNVRAFLGTDNPVNKEIAATLAGENRTQFILLNNGVTIVADAGEITKKGWGAKNQELELSNYQIVNGLQTSHVLYKQRQYLGPDGDVYVPLKIVITGDHALQTAIARATNSQTNIDAAQRLSLSPFMVALEKSFDQLRLDTPQRPLWFERRSEQYRSDPAIADDNQVFDQNDLLRIVAATFLRLPHRASDGPAALKDKVAFQIFNETHAHLPYLTAARLAYQVRSFLLQDKTGEFNRFEYHFYFGLHYLLDPSKTATDLASEECLRNCDVINRRLANSERVDEAVALVAAAIRATKKPVRNGTSAWRNLPRLRDAMTKPLEKKLSAKKKTIDWG